MLARLNFRARIRRVKPAQIALAVVVAFFLAKSADYIARHGKRLHDQDTGSEDNTWTAAKAFTQDGLAASCGLPKYGRYNLDSPSAPIAKSDYYTHYFPGPDYVLFAAYAFFGVSNSVAQWARGIPLLHFLFAALLFLWIGQRKLWPKLEWATPAIALLLLLSPANRVWALHLHGHGYVTAYTLLALCLGLRADLSRRANKTLPLLCAAALGFASNYMLLTNAFVVCAAPLVGALLISPAESGKALFADRIARTGLLLSACVGAGLLLAYAAHFAQISCLFGFREAALDQLGTFSARIHKIQDGTTAITRTQLLGRYSDQAFGFFGLSALGMLAFGALFAFLQRPRLPLTLAILVSTLAAYAWVLALPSHARGHFHVNPRIFLLPWVCFLALTARFLSAYRSGLNRLKPPA